MPDLAGGPSARDRLLASQAAAAAAAAGPKLNLAWLATCHLDIEVFECPPPPHLRAGFAGLQVGFAS
jgi:hypothetical protein